MIASEVYNYLNISLSLEEWNSLKGKDFVTYNCSKCLNLHSRTKSNICDILRYSKNKLLSCSNKCANTNKNISHEEFVTRSNILHKNKYIYPNPIVNTTTLLKIVCPLHGELEVLPKTHLQGGQACLLCYKDTRCKSQVDWENDAAAIWKGLYSYPGIYTSAHIPAEIACKVHGSFYQTPANHLSGKGCLSCAQELSGFNKSAWIEKAKFSRFFDSWKVYVVKIYNDSETFVKIGRTFTTTAYRLGKKITSSKLNGYSYSVVGEVIFNTPEECWDFETYLHQKYIKDSYIPSKPFGGMYECFKLTQEQLNDLQSHVRQD